MHHAYSNILRRCGLKFRAVDADSGAIGGSGSQEFMVLADAGEDEVLYTDDGKYAANVEKAVSLVADPVTSSFTSPEKWATPDTDTIEKLCNFLDCSPTQIVKNVLYQAILDQGQTLLVLVSIRGDQEVNEVKLQNALTNLAGEYGGKTVLSLTVPDPEAQAKWAAQPLPLGYISPGLANSYIKPVKPTPVGRQATGTVIAKFLRLVDKTAVDLTNFVTGADEAGYHVVGANWDTEQAGESKQAKGKMDSLLPSALCPLPSLVVDVRTAKVGDRAVHDPNQTLQTARGIEIGHIFQLGNKYSQAMGATYTNEQGEEVPLVMGCYGVGVSRLAQAAVEQSYDKDGIIWPVAIAPYQAIVVIPNMSEVAQVEAATKLYQELNAAGVETLLDDRAERAGVKFKDADLIGIPYRIVTGRSLAEGKVELVQRASRASEEVALAEVVGRLKQALALPPHRGIAEACQG
jgi:prolyl-tRNA synthetase